MHPTVSLSQAQVELLGPERSSGYQGCGDIPSRRCAPPHHTGTTGCAASAAGQSRAPPPHTSQRRPQTTPCSHFSTFISFLHALQSAAAFQLLSSTSRQGNHPSLSQSMAMELSLFAKTLHPAGASERPMIVPDPVAVACLRHFSRDAHLQRCPTRDSGPLLGRQEAASWLPKILSRRSSSRPAHHSRYQLVSTWPCSFPWQSIGLRQGPEGSDIPGANHALRSGFLGLHTAGNKCRDNRCSVDSSLGVPESWHAEIVWLGSCAKLHHMASHALGMLEQPTWLLSWRLRRGSLPLICLWFQAHRVLLRLRCRAARAAQRGGAARRAILLARRGCRCGFLSARSCGCCFGRSLCCALLLPTQEATSPQAGVTAPHSLSCKMGCDV